jgi:putative flavoprotein involved in K+ transport
MTESIPAVIVGGGPAGITTSYFLGQRHIPHIVLEMERAFSEWYRRWDSFYMNTANWMNDLPGAKEDFAAGANRDGLGSKADALRYFESYLAAVRPPLREFTEATSVRQSRHDTWTVATPDGKYETGNVVICSGVLREPKRPPVAAELPTDLFQLHSTEYRNPKQIEPGHVLLVGSGNSGIQICEDLALSGRFDKLTLAVSGNLTIPLEVLGIPIFTLMRWFRLLDFKPNTWIGRRLVPMNKGDPTLPPSPKKLAERYGVELVGKVSAFKGADIHCVDGSTVPLEGLGVIWCTGFESRFDFIDPAHGNGVFDPAGQPIHDRGVVPSVPGLYFVGLRAQHTVASQSLYGMVKDAQYVAGHIAARERP